MTPEQAERLVAAVESIAASQDRIADAVCTYGGDGPTSTLDQIHSVLDSLLEAVAPENDKGERHASIIVSGYIHNGDL